MTTTQKILSLLAAFLLVCVPLRAQSGQPAAVTGKITADGEGAITYATVYLKGTARRAATDDEGRYRLQVPAGSYELIVTATGYKGAQRILRLRAGERRQLDVRLEPNEQQLGEAVVTAGAVDRVNRSAFNAVAVDASALHNTTQNLSDVLAKAPGLKLRESGGVGSDMQFMMDGFSGRHVKVFIDGVPQEGVGAGFGLNNIPASYAERIEVYRGVVPVAFGTDALGGVVNIVTGRRPRPWHLDASYSYGSFNTHKSYVNFGQTFRSGLMYEVNAFQNYSDNSYHIDTPVEHFMPDGSSSLDATRVEHVKRFHDTYHNEAVFGKVGFVGRSFADRLVLGFGYTHFYQEIQNGVIQKVVFGQKFRQGHSFMPSLEYRKRDLFVSGLDVTATANYNANRTHNVDTATYRYNWLGESLYMKGQAGEQSYQDAHYDNDNWSATATVNYRLGSRHTFTLSHVVNTFRRKNQEAFGTSGSSAEAEAIDKKTRKNITGLSYRFLPSRAWNFTIFGKYYNQSNSGPVSQSESGTDDYVRLSKRVSAFGYGAAGTWFPLKGVQAKLSYEKTYRLPTTDELFGDEDLELGQIGLKPEHSHNLNMNLSYSGRWGRHGLYAEGSFVYRDTKDYIQRSIGTYSGNRTYASYENHGKVRTKGFNLSARYTCGEWGSVGANFTQMDVRDNVKTIGGNTAQASLTYGARMPNLPYRFANVDLSLHWPGLFAPDNRLTLTYDNLYMHSFPLYSEALGDPSTKSVVPTQFSHNLTLTYSVAKGRFNFSLECRNFTDEKLYDNFSLQKAGRAFYGKVRVSL